MTYLRDNPSVRLSLHEKFAAPKNEEEEAKDLAQDYKEELTKLIPKLKNVKIPNIEDPQDISKMLKKATSKAEAYKEYIEKKQKEGEKPKSQEDWERYVYGKSKFSDKTMTLVKEFYKKREEIGEKYKDKLDQTKKELVSKVKNILEEKEKRGKKEGLKPEVLERLLQGEKDKLKKEIQKEVNKSIMWQMAKRKKLETEYMTKDKDFKKAADIKRAPKWVLPGLVILLAITML